MGNFSFGLEYDAGSGTPTAFIGKILTTKDARSGPEDREAPVAKTAQAIRCASCGKPYEGPRVETTEMVVCQACGAGLELDEGRGSGLREECRQETAVHFCRGNTAHSGRRDL